MERRLEEKDRYGALEEERDLGVQKTCSRAEHVYAECYHGVI